MPYSAAAAKSKSGVLPVYECKACMRQKANSSKPGRNKYCTLLKRCDLLNSMLRCHGRSGRRHGFCRRPRARKRRHIRIFDSIRFAVTSGKSLFHWIFQLISLFHT